jgi:hypothetical protein
MLVGSEKTERPTSNAFLEEKIVPSRARRIFFKHLGCEDAELYGAGQHLRRLGFYPQSLPICCMIQHGVSLWDNPQNYQLFSKLPYMLVFSKRMEKAWKELSKKPCFAVKNPFTLELAKARSKVEDSSRQGTLFFFSHSTKEIDTETNFAQLFLALESLPPQFHPITICLHFRDIEKGLHSIFVKKGWKCETAGHWEDSKFSENFYRLLLSHRYAMSNTIGSYSFYAVHAGIAFSLLGPEPIYNNRGDYSLPLGLASTDFVSSQRPAMRATKLFSGLFIEPTEEQKSFVSDELGINGTVSRIKLSALLYSSLMVQLRISIRRRIPWGLPK